MADPYKNNVVLYLPMEGSRDGDTVILDKTGKTVTRNGDAHLSTDVVPPFGTTSCYFDGTGDYLSLASSADWLFAAKNFTVEYWLCPGSVSVNQAHVDARATYAACGWVIVQSAATPDKISFSVGDSSTTSWEVTVAGTTILVVGTWYHVAAVRYGDQFMLFVDGVVQGSATWSGTIDTTSTSLLVGAATPGTNVPLNGYIKDLRITKGVARYAGNFYVDRKPVDWDEPEQPRIML